MAAAWPQIVDSLTTTLPTLPGWETVAVFDGPANTGDDPTDYCTIGHTETGDAAGDFQQTPSDNGFGVQEDGTILCDLICQSGDDTMSTVRTRAFTLADALDDQLRTDPTFGGLLPQGLTVAYLTVTPQNISAQGVACQLLLTVTYRTETWNPNVL